VSTTPPLDALITTVATRLMTALEDPSTPPGQLAQIAGVALRALVAAERRNPGAPDGAPAAPAATPGPSGHPDLPELISTLPGPPWDPWRGVSVDTMQTLECEMRARQAVWHEESRARLARLPGVRAAMVGVRADLRAIRAGVDPDQVSRDCRARIYLRAHSESQSPDFETRAGEGHLPAE
jgi:hypothetical protein